MCICSLLFIKDKIYFCSFVNLELPKLKLGLVLNALVVQSIMKLIMADGRPPAPQPPPVVSPASHVQLPAPSTQPIVPPVQPLAPPTQPIQPAPMPQLNWSHFKPELTGKPDENAKAQLRRTNDWMDTHAFPEGVKVHLSCLTLVGEARLWYGMNH